MSGPSFGWHVESAWQGDWDLVLYEVRCTCGRWLAKAEPVMGETGIRAVEGDCKKHGHVTAGTWDVIDAAEIGGQASRQAEKETA